MFRRFTRIMNSVDINQNYSGNCYSYIIYTIFYALLLIKFLIGTSGKLLDLKKIFQISILIF
jgi:hypothetical protein